MDIKLEYILDIADKDENIRAVILYGSRADGYVKNDIYQDYDVVYVVDRIGEFDISVYEDVELLFIPSEIYPELFKNEDLYLMQFSDFSRIDLTVCNIETLVKKFNNGGIMKYLMDKDNCIKGLNENDNSSSWVKPITSEFFADTCSEFFWEIQNAVKGMKRDELSFAMFIRDNPLREMLNRIIDTYIGMDNDYKVTVGTLGKYRKLYLSSEYYKLYESTYVYNTYIDFQESIYAMVQLFSELAKIIANEYNFEYPKKSEEFVISYLNYMFK